MAFWTKAALICFSCLLVVLIRLCLSNKRSSRLVELYWKKYQNNRTHFIEKWQWILNSREKKERLAFRLPLTFDGIWKQTKNGWLKTNKLLEKKNEIEWNKNSRKLTMAKLRADPFWNGPKRFPRFFNGKTKRPENSNVKTIWNFWQRKKATAISLFALRLFDNHK